MHRYIMQPLGIKQVTQVFQPALKGRKNDQLAAAIDRFQQEPNTVAHS